MLSGTLDCCIQVGVKTQMLAAPVGNPLWGKPLFPGGERIPKSP